MQQAIIYYTSNVLNAFIYNVKGTTQVTQYIIFSPTDTNQQAFHLLK